MISAFSLNLLHFFLGFPALRTSTCISCIQLNIAITLVKVCMSPAAAVGSYVEQYHGICGHIRSLCLFDFSKMETAQLCP
jgi:hypothetical protein